MANRGENGLGRSDEQKDPLVWLKAEIQKASEGEGVPPDDLKDLDALAEALARGIRMAHLSARAVEAVVEMLPSESLDQEFIREVLELRAAADGSTPDPGGAIKQMREATRVDLRIAAEALCVSAERLEEVEAGRLPWYELPPENLPRFAEAVRKPWKAVLLQLKLAAELYFSSRVQERLRLRLGRFDSLQSQSAARLQSVKFALAALRDENRSAHEFFRRAEAAAGGHGGR